MLQLTAHAEPAHSTLLLLQMFVAPEAQLLAELEPGESQWRGLRQAASRQSVIQRELPPADFNKEQLSVSRLLQECNLLEE